jgi:hypothetical protein
MIYFLSEKGQEVLNESKLDSSIIETDFEDNSFSFSNKLLWKMIRLKIKGITISHSSYK